MDSSRAVLLQLLLATLLARGNKEWTEITKVNNKSFKSIDIVYYSKDYKVETEGSNLLMMPIRLGGIALVILQMVAFMHIVLHFYVWTEWNELGDDTEMIELIALEKDKRSRDRKKRAERRRRRRRRRAARLLSRKGPKGNKQSYPTYSKEHLVSVKDDFDEENSEAQTQYESYERVEGRSNQSTRLPRAKKGHQQDFLKAQEEFLDEEDEEEAKFLKEQNELRGAKDGGDIYKSIVNSESNDEEKPVTAKYRESIMKREFKEPIDEIVRTKLPKASSPGRKGPSTKKS